ncbi:hypothetical protein EVAR_87176_1 [Eumeta japonica]|uniref:Reverse transcriptase domain-containing protein n=1 Tax=Eumeta variegata TaxID=151549 RepID=A0A4C1VXT2_EUMVA|nr:hypothetical protein EVAR_87176_1 [Eumeta japonica]
MVSLDIKGAFDNTWWLAIRNQLLGHNCPVNLYSMYGDGLSDRPGGCGSLRQRAVQEDNFEGLYTELHSRSNLLESRPGLLILRTRGSRPIRAGVRGRRCPYVFRTVSLSTGGGG